MGAKKKTNARWLIVARKWNAMHGKLRWRRWSSLRKAQVIGALAGALITIAVPVANIGYGLFTVQEPHQPLFNWFTIAAILVYYLPVVILRGFGWNAFVNNGSLVLSLLFLFLAVLINSFMGFLVATAIATLIRWVRWTVTKTP